MNNLTLDTYDWKPPRRSEKWPKSLNHKSNKQANKSDTSNFPFKKDQILETADIYGQVFIVNI